MSQPEQQLWKLIKPHLPGDVSRVENMADEGTPDVSGAWGIDYWIELKVCQNKKALADPATLLRDSQIVWHLRRARQGSIIFVAVRYPKQKKIIVYKPEYTSTCMAHHVTYLPAIIFECKPRYNWDDFTKQFKILLQEARNGICNTRTK